MIHLFLLLGFPCGATGKESTYNGGDLGLTPGLERSPGEGKGYPLQYSGLENSMDYVVHGVAKSRTGLSNFYLLLLLLYVVNIVTSVSSFVYVCDFLMMKCKKLKSSLWLQLCEDCIVEK